MAGVQRRTFAGEFPIESPGDLWQGYPKGEGAEREARFDRALAHLPRNLGYLVVGRQIGLLPYLPFALFALLLALKAPRDRHRMLLLGALGAYALGVPPAAQRRAPHRRRGERRHRSASPPRRGTGLPSPP